MACAAIGDVTAWCVLVLLVAMAGTGGTTEFVTVVALTLAFGAVMAFITRPLLATYVGRVSGPVLPALISAGVL
jgi:Kef-type K+ transport system membrane component KefB